MCSIFAYRPYIPHLFEFFWLSTRYFGLFREGGGGGPPTFWARVGGGPTFGPAREMARDHPSPDDNPAKSSIFDPERRLYIKIHLRAKPRIH